MSRHTDDSAPSCLRRSALPERGTRNRHGVRHRRRSSGRRRRRPETPHARGVWLLAPPAPGAYRPRLDAHTFALGRHPSPRVPAVMSPTDTAGTDAAPHVPALPHSPLAAHRRRAHGYSIATSPRPVQFRTYMRAEQRKSLHRPHVLEWACEELNLGPHAYQAQPAPGSGQTCIVNIRAVEGNGSDGWGLGVGVWRLVCRRVCHRATSSKEKA